MESSDIDLIVDFDKLKIDDYANNNYNLKIALQCVFNRPLDLLEEKAIRNPYFILSIADQRELVYG